MNLRELTGEGDPLVPALFELYHLSFDRDCRDPDEQVRAEMRGEFRVPYRFHVIEAGDGLAAFIRWAYLPQTEAAFVVHIAVDPRWQGTGLGRALLQPLPEDRPALLEVERVQDAHSPADREVRRKRLDWFARQGARLLTATYTQPALHPDTPAVPLNLLAIRRDLILEPNKAIAAFYREVWELPPDHEFVLRACEGVGK